ncbi:MAG TPA: transglycosylase domain-containing protein [Actinomycetota bacterium]|nr:transglycosylase domain-containing protein [Actinomycetota bacterium]
MKAATAVLRAMEWADLSGSGVPTLSRRWVDSPKAFLMEAKLRWPWALAAGAVSILGALGVVIWMATFDIPSLAPQAQSSRVLAADGRLIATLHGEEDRTVVELSNISKHLRSAVLLAEDRDFFEHGGMSYKGIVRAAYTNFAGGGIRQGGSTITQQYARNAFPSIGRERTVTRKLKEAFWAVQLEQHLSKGEIMQRYLNTVYFGRGAYGAEAAARTYFKVPAADLTVGQAAYLAGVIRSPERYQIDEDPQGATRLRNQVIDALAGARAITEAEARKAKQEKLAQQFKPGASVELESPRAGYFVEYVRRTLKSEYGLSDGQILRGGLDISTTLDLDMQDAAEDAVKGVLNRPDDPEAALVAMGPQGEIRAMVGGRDVSSVSRSRGFNFATDGGSNGGGRQAGSAFKPIALAAFLSEGKSIASTYSGASPIEIQSGRCRNQDGSAWKVSNFEDASYGPIDVASATVSSVNTVYAQMMNTVVTPAEFMATAARTGIEIPRFDAGCALALGTSDVTPLEMARAYTTFAQRGNRPDPIAIVRVTDPSGRVLVENSPKVTQALERNVADTVNYVLERNIRSGTGTGAKIGRPAAGKTGTTQNHANAWFAGYTPNLTAVVWMGYAPGPDGTIKEMKDVHGIEVTGGSLPATIWRRFMSQAVRKLPEASFRKPSLAGQAVSYGGENPSSAKLAQSSTPSTTSAGRDGQPADDEEAPPTGADGRDVDTGPPAEPSEPRVEQPENPAPRRQEPETRSAPPSSPGSPTDRFGSCFPFCD